MQPSQAADLNQIRKNILARPTINIGSKQILQLYTEIYTPRAGAQEDESSSVEEELPMRRITTEGSDPYSEEAPPKVPEQPIEEFKEEVQLVDVDKEELLQPKSQQRSHTAGASRASSRPSKGSAYTTQLRQKLSTRDKRIRRIKTNDANITYDKLIGHIEDHHPFQVVQEFQDADEEDAITSNHNTIEKLVTEKTRFGICAHVGSVLRFYSDEELISQIGLGPGLLLLTLKALIWLFVLICILSTPLIVLYSYDSREHLDRMKELLASNNRSALNVVLKAITLGGIPGANYVACQSRNMAEYLQASSIGDSAYIRGNTTMGLTCNDGYELGPILEYGLSTSNKTTCTTVEQRPFANHSYFQQNQDLIHNLLTFGVPPASHSNQVEAERRAQLNETLHYGSDLSLSLTYSRAVAVTTLPHHYLNEETSNDELYLGPHLYLQESYQQLMAFTRIANIDDEIESQFKKTDLAKTNKENDEISAEKATFLQQVKLSHQVYLDSITRAAATCSDSNFKRDYCVIKIQAAERNRDAIMSTWQTEVQYLQIKYKQQFQTIVEDVVKAAKANIKVQYAEFQKLTEEFQPYVKCFDETIEMPFYARPQNWFELDYQCNCRGKKKKCQLPIGGALDVSTLLASKQQTASSTTKTTSKNTNDSAQTTTNTVTWRLSSQASEAVVQQYQANTNKDFKSFLSRPQPDLMVTYECVSNTFFDPLTQQTISKQQLGWYISSIQTTITVLLALFIGCLDKKQHLMIMKYRNSRIKTSDFTIRVSNLPSDIEFGGDLEVLKACLELHFLDIIKQQLKKEMLEDGNLTKAATQAIDEPDQNVLQAYPWEVVHIGLMNYDKEHIDYLDRLTKVKDSYYQNQIKIRRNREQSEISKLEISNSTSIKEFAALKQLLIGSRERMAERIKDKMKKMKRKHITPQYLQARTFRYAHVTFRKLDAVGYVMRAYGLKHDEDGHMFQNRKLRDRVCCKRVYQPPKKHFFSRCPKIEEAEEPMDQLVTNYKRSIIVNWLGKLVGQLSILGLLHIAALILLAHKNSIHNALTINQTSSFFNSRLKCPDQVTQQDAQFDLLLPEPRGLLGCFCEREFNTLGYSVKDIKFQTQLINDDKELTYLQALLNIDETELRNRIHKKEQSLNCLNWTESKEQIEASDVQFGVLVVSLNLIGGQLIHLSIKHLHGYLTKPEEELAVYITTFVYQFICSIIYVFGVNFNLFSFVIADTSQNQIFSLDGDFYEKVSLQLFTIIAIQMITTLAMRLAVPIMHIGRRCVDRRGRLTILNDDEVVTDMVKDEEQHQANNAVTNPETGEVQLPAQKSELHSSKLIQEQINALYTGTRIQATMILAELQVIFFAVVIFGAGMPILYYMLLAFLITSYWIYKCLILKYYRSSDSFSEKLSRAFLKFLKLGLLLHMVATYSQLTNESLLPGKYSAMNPRKPSQNGDILQFHHNLSEQGHGLLYLCFCISILVIYFINAVILKIPRCKGAEEDEGKWANLRATDFFKEISINQLTNHFNDAYYAFKDFDVRAAIPAEVIKFRFRQEVSCTSELYEWRLGRRLDQMERMIDHHFDHLEEIDPDLLQSLSKPTAMKLQVLHKYECWLKPNKTRLERRQLARFRMENHLHSYKVLENPQFQHLKPMADLMQDTRYLYTLDGTRSALELKAMFGIIQQQKQTLQNLKSDFTFQVEKTERLEAMVSSLAGVALNRAEAAGTVELEQLGQVADDDDQDSDERRMSELQDEITRKQQELGRLGQKKQNKPELHRSAADNEDLENTAEQADSEMKGTLSASLPGAEAGASLLKPE